MTRWYIDSSAAMKLVLREAESGALLDQMDADRPSLVSCRLLETEMRRAAHRSGDLSQEKVTTFLEKVNLFDVPNHLFTEAGLLPGARLRSLDAIHVAAAVALDAPVVLTYDTRMAESARDLGLRVLSPA